MESEPPPDCQLCPRLVAFRDENAHAFPAWFNAPVPSFGEPETARLLIVGLAPGLKGANRTGRPFTGDHAGGLLYDMIAAYGFSSGRYQEKPDDGLELREALITNAVRCVPPQNKPTPAEISNCRPFLSARIASLPNLKAILALGHVAHDQTLVALGLRKSLFAFAHGARHDLPTDVRPGRHTPIAGLTLFDSFHCSRYNTSTRRLTPGMFQAVFQDIRSHLDATTA